MKNILIYTLLISAALSFTAEAGGRGSGKYDTIGQENDSDGNNASKAKDVKYQQMNDAEQNSDSSN